VYSCVFIHVVALFANGANLHTAIHHYMSGKPEEELVLLPANDGHWQSIESVLTDITDVVCLEKPVRHRYLRYCGVLDCIAEYRSVYYNTMASERISVGRLEPSHFQNWDGFHVILPSRASHFLHARNALLLFYCA